MKNPGDGTQEKKDKKIKKDKNGGYFELEHDMRYITDINTNGRKLFNFKYIGIGLIFLIDFNVKTIDFLPDLIAFAFISAGIGKACFVNENFNKAKNYLNIFCAVSSFKLVLNILYLIFGQYKNYFIIENGLRYDEIFNGNILLMFTFVFSAAELFLIINIFRNIFRAVEEFCLASGSMSHTKNSDFILKILYSFFTVKFILTVTAQIPALFSESNFDTLSIMFNSFLDINVLEKLIIPPFFIVQTLFGLFMLSIVMPFFFGIAKDKNLCVFIKSQINRILISDIFFILKRTLNAAFSVFMAGCVFFIDLQFDNINLTPDFVICIFFIIAVSLIKSTDNDMRNIKLDFYLIINFFVSLASYILMTVYKIKAAYSFAEDMPFVHNLKIISDLVYHTSVILFFLIFIEIYFFIKKLRKKHLEFAATYLKKYLTPLERKERDEIEEEINKVNAGEKGDERKNKIFIAASAVFCVKTLQVVLPPDGTVIFFHSLILIIFVFFVVRALYITKESIYSFYK